MGGNLQSHWLFHRAWSLQLAAEGNACLSILVWRDSCGGKCGWRDRCTRVLLSDFGAKYAYHLLVFVAVSQRLWRRLSPKPLPLLCSAHWPHRHLKYGFHIACLWLQEDSHCPSRSPLELPVVPPPQTEIQDATLRCVPVSVARIFALPHEPKSFLPLDFTSLWLVQVDEHIMPYAYSTNVFSTSVSLSVQPSLSMLRSIFLFTIPAPSSVAIPSRRVLEVVLYIQPLSPRPRDRLNLAVFLFCVPCEALSSFHAFLHPLSHLKPLLPFVLQLLTAQSHFKSERPA